ncbi:hypothetical protein CP8484711_1978A, partial [Chlamydia psittaci 84-8471/1]
MQILLKK